MYDDDLSISNGSPLNPKGPAMTRSSQLAGSGETVSENAEAALRDPVGLYGMTVVIEGDLPSLADDEDEEDEDEEDDDDFDDDDDYEDDDDDDDDDEEDDDDEVPE
jgi:hypothetical protein